MATQRICSIPDCGKPVKSRGWCNNHYALWYRNGAPERAKSTPEEQWEFFLTKVLPCKSDKCLIWPYTKGSFGYGRMIRNGKQRYVHRLACEATYGQPVGEARDVAHSCGNGHLGCVNPRHLRWATKSENNADKIRHGRSNRGEANPKAKLSENEVRVIKSLLGTATQTSIAEQFGVSNNLISEIARGNVWGWLLPHK